MAIGFPQTKADIDSRAGALATSVRDLLGQVQRFQQYLVATPDANLTGLGYSTTEVAQLKSAFTDLDKLRTIYEGTGTQASVYDFRQFAKLLTGVQ